MIDKRTSNSCKIFEEMSSEDLTKWFEFKQQKFLHNVDTFYYSVKFQNDFRQESRDPNVKIFRKFFKIKYDALREWGSSEWFTLPKLSRDLVLRPVSFSKYYTVCLSYPDYFDIFFAPVVPKGADGGESVTCECIVQIRSYMLWQMGVKDAFENSYDYVKKISRFFKLKIDFVQENRIDYCWHSNYLRDPDKFFSPENFYKMRVDRFKNATYVTNKVGSENYEIDYVALGKRSDKVFVRIYQKTREVIEQNYKPWFLKVWKMNGLINNYDLFVYERAYQKKSWHYRFTARLEFYAMHGQDPEMVKRCNDVLSGDVQLEEEQLIRLADQLTPKLNFVINVEFQTMRRHSKSYELIPFKDHSDKGECSRIYEYLDNRKLITDYLTEKVLRLVDYDPDIKKSERECCAFWKALRRTKCLDVRMTSDQAKLIRNYNRKLSAEAVKKRFINAAVTFGLYTRGENSSSPIQDAFEAMLRMNDNDVQNARKYKEKKLRQLNPDELAEVFSGCVEHPIQFIDPETGTLYDYNNLIYYGLQEESGGSGYEVDWNDV